MPKTPVRTKKQTFSLDKEVVVALNELANKGAIVSKSDFVEQAIKQQMDSLRQRWFKQEFAKAAKDPLLQADIRRVQKDYRFIDSEFSE